MPYLIVEYEFDPPLTPEALSGAFEALKPCLAMRDVKRLRSWFAEDGRRGFCEYEALDAQSVRDAYQIANVPYVRVWAGKLYEFNAPQTPP